MLPAINIGRLTRLTTPEQKLAKHRRAVTSPRMAPPKPPLTENLQNIVTPFIFSALRDLPTPGPRPLTPARRAGITLMEMIVVVAIIAAIAGISFPAVSAGIDSVRLRSATDSTAAFLNAAVVRVERRQEPIELLVYPRENAIQLLSNQPGFTRVLKMPDGIAIEGVVPSDPEEQGPHRLILLPGAAVPALGIRIANRHGSRALVHLDPATGFPRVESITQ